MNPVRLSLLQAQLEGCAEVMGSALARSAFSPNIRVRLDFSCALFDPQGNLLAQAAHIPVHLGSMPDQIKSLVADHKLQAGDLYIANDPYNGGTHLPDITLMEPVFTEDGHYLGIVAARAHHADVGGAAPGSMASQKNIYGDGLRIPILKLANKGEWDPALRRLLLANMRSPRDREGDLLAQQAACRYGCEGLLRVYRQWARSDPSLLTKGLEELTQQSALGTKKALLELIDPEIISATFEDQLEVGEEGVPIKVGLTLNPDGTLLADFRGTSAGVAASFNATLPVTRAAVCYVVRCLVPASLPLNQGFLDCIEVKAAPGCLVHAVYPQAVAAGNVETSQRIVDVVFGAFQHFVPQKIPAASAGTMNNLSFGFSDSSFGVHYETAGGGSGGLPGTTEKGCSGTQVHMTNTRSTPTEVLEEEFPVRVEQHAFRTNSGGQGVSSGGDGTLKEITFLAEAEVTFMTTRRTTAPYGLEGGAAGKPGYQQVRPSQGEWLSVPASSSHSLPAGSAIRLATPGGGGHGPPNGKNRTQKK